MLNICILRIRKFFKEAIGTVPLLLPGDNVVFCAEASEPSRCFPIYTQEADLLELIQNFLVYAVFFQLSDAIAAPIQGALRGYKDVKVTFLMAVLSYWVIGMPVGYLLAKFTGLQAYGYWVGFIVGLAVGAAVLLARLIRLQKKQKL